MEKETCLIVLLRNSLASSLIFGSTLNTQAFQKLDVRNLHIKTVFINFYVIDRTIELEHYSRNLYKHLISISQHSYYLFEKTHTHSFDSKPDKPVLNIIHRLIDQISHYQRTIAGLRLRGL